MINSSANDENCTKSTKFIIFSFKRAKLKWFIFVIYQARTKQNRWAKGRNSRMSKQVVVQRILPLQPGITQPFSVLPTADVNYPIENAIIKPSASTSSSSSSSTSSSVEYKSSLTEENLSRMNNLSENTNSNSHLRSTDSNSSSNSIRSIDSNSSTSQQHPKCDSGIETSDMIDSGSDKSKHADYDVVDDIVEEEENNRLRQRLNDDPGIQSLMEISLPSPIPIVSSTDECKFEYLYLFTFH